MRFPPAPEVNDEPPRLVPDLELFLESLRRDLEVLLFRSPRFDDDRPTVLRELAPALDARGPPIPLWSFFVRSGSGIP